MTDLEILLKELKDRHKSLVHQSLDTGYHADKMFMNGRVTELGYIIQLIQELEKKD